MSNKFVLGVGTFLALALACTFPAHAQVHAGTAYTPSYDDTVPRDACAPRYQVVADGAYVGCDNEKQSAHVPQVRVDIGNRPPVIPTVTNGGPGRGGGLEFVTTESAMMMYGAEYVDIMIDDSYRACRSIERRQGWSKVWSFVRPILTIYGIQYGTKEFGKPYGHLLTIMGVKEEVGSFIGEGDSRDWRELMINYCTLSKNYEKKHAKSLTDANSGY